jgi:hypothetical protein
VKMRTSVKLGGDMPESFDARDYMKTEMPEFDGGDYVNTPLPDGGAAAPAPAGGSAGPPAEAAPPADATPVDEPKLWRVGRHWGREG